MKITKSEPRLIANDKTGNFDKSLDTHFLAGRSLRNTKVASLLLSASFGANALLYAAFLGYLIGLWALIIQVAWTLSFYLLSNYSRQIYKSTSLHEYLGSMFGSATRRTAAICSIVGIAYFVGWEIAVAKSSLESLANLSGGVHAHFWKTLSISLLVAVILAAIFYTSIWGRKASGAVNLFLNLIKVVCLAIITLILVSSVFSNHGLSKELFFPSFKQAVLSLTIVGFITNLIFNLSWQFVDNSSWQSISSSRRGDNKENARTIKLAGLSTLITVNGLGVLLGTLLRNNSSVDSTNILGQVVHMSSNLQIVSLIAMVILIAFSAMSLFDEAILSISQSILVDLNIAWRKGNKITATHARIATLIVGVIASIGVSLIIQALGGSIFNFVYAVIIAQLSLAGPVIVGLVRPNHAKGMWLAIVLGLLTGTVATIMGTIHNNSNLLQSAGTLTMTVSLIVATALYYRSKSLLSDE